MSTVICAALFALGGSLNVVALPAGEPVHAGMDNGSPSVCVLAANDTRPAQERLMSPRPDRIARMFVVVPTYWQLSDSTSYVASFTYSDGFVWSVFEVTP